MKSNEFISILEKIYIADRYFAIPKDFKGFLVERNDFSFQLEALLTYQFKL